MAANLLASTIVVGKTAVQSVINTAATIVSNAVSSGKVLKINALYISNINSSPASVNVDIYRTSTAYRMGCAITIPSTTTFDVISKTIYLEEGDSLRLTASANNYLEAVCSYEDIT